MRALAVALPPSLVNEDRRKWLRGYTELILGHSKCALHVDDWERRLLSLKGAVQEVVTLTPPTVKGVHKSAGESFMAAAGKNFKLPKVVVERLREAGEEISKNASRSIAEAAKQLKAEPPRLTPIYPSSSSVPLAKTTRRKRPGRKSKPDRDAEILKAVESGQYSTLQAVGVAFGLSRSAVSKAKKRALDRRKSQ